MSFKLLLGEGSEIFSNMFWLRGEESVYFNIKGKRSVIQVFFKERECNLLYK